jgi:hypothetical protein
MQQIVSLAIEDHRGAFELAKLQGGRSELSPITVFMHYHAEVFEALEGGDLTVERLAEIRRKNKEVIDFTRKMTEDAHRK